MEPYYVSESAIADIDCLNCQNYEVFYRVMGPNNLPVVDDIKNRAHAKQMTELLNEAYKQGENARCKSRA